MAFEQPGFKDASCQAAANLSAKQFYLVKLVNVSGVAKAAAITAATDTPYGALQNQPLLGDPCEIVNSGIAKVRAGGVIAAGAKLMPDATGKVVTCTPGTDESKYQIGQALENATADGDIIACNISCIGAGWLTPAGDGSSSPGGTTGQLQFNDGGALGGVTDSSVDGANVTLGGDLTLENIKGIPGVGVAGGDVNITSGAVDDPLNATGAVTVKCANNTSNSLPATDTAFTLGTIGIQAGHILIDGGDVCDISSGEVLFEAPVIENDAGVLFTFGGDVISLAGGAQVADETDYTSGVYGGKATLHGGDVARIDATHSAFGAEIRAQGGNHIDGWKGGNVYLTAGAGDDEDGSIVFFTSQRGAVSAFLNGTERFSFSLESPSEVTVDQVRLTALAPTATPDDGAGTGGTATIQGNDLAHRIIVNTGTLPDTNIVIAQITFNAAHVIAPFIMLSPSNAAAAAVVGPVFVPFNNITPTGYTLNIGAVALAASTEYIWTAHVIG